ncbi:MAG: hypothetical protein LUE99_19425 [Bacteroides sp.]|nr:hypothetical protein [Bacteroides sp.]
MTVKEIIQMENSNQNTIILLREGIFWRAYEKSAYAFSMQIHPYKATRKWVIAVKQDVISLGFPVSAVENVLKDCKIVLQQEDRLIFAALPTVAGEFEAWKQAVPLALPDNGRNQKTNPYPDIPAAEPATKAVTPTATPAKDDNGTVAECIRRFSIESKTPVECMLFLMELKRRLAE